jgi:HNH endonuclease
VPVVTGRVDHDLLDQLTHQLTTTTPWSQPPAPGPDGPGDGPGRDAVRDKVKDLILANAVALLSGPGGLASVLRTGALPPPAAGISLPLDIGTPTDTIPAHLRRAVILRDQHCGAPGCTVPPAGCQIHHLIPRSQGGPTSLSNLGLYCTFHHLIAIHRWGWTIALNPDGTTTMTSPDGSRTYHSHSPPTAAA